MPSRHCTSLVCSPCSSHSRKIRAQPPCSTAAFLVALEHSCADQAQALLELSHTRCVIKVFDHEYLARTIEEMLPQSARPNA